MIQKLEPSLSPKALLEALNSRYAVKKFDPSRKIPADIVSALEESMLLTPSSYGLQPWKFVVITDPSIREKLRPVSWNQPQITDASHLVVFATLSRVTEGWIDQFMNRIVEIRGVAPTSLAGFKNAIMQDAVTGPRSQIAESWLAHQAYIALGQLMLSAAILGVDACPMEGLDPKQYDKILGFDGSEFATRVVCALGYRSSDDPFSKMIKVRFDRSLVVDRLD